MRDLQTAARTLGLRLHVVHASAVRDFDAVFAGLSPLGGGTLALLALANEVIE